MSATELAPTFFLALIVILLVCRLVGWVLRAAGQPPVVGEMVAGVVLGPSVLGLLAPGVENFVFPQQLRPVLYVVGQIGLVVFMFKSGYEFRTEQVRRVAGPASLISTAGMVAPLVLGGLLTWLAVGRVNIFPPGVPLFVSIAFVGVTLAITAFPMLARIILERGLTGTRFGSIALACGALDDAVAWLLLAAVLSIAAGSAGPVSLAVGGTFVLLALLAVVARVRGRVVPVTGRLAPEHLLLAVVVVLFLAAWYTDKIGLYAVFGAFSLGVVFPRSEAVDRAVDKLTPVATVFLPLFFTYSGLNTDFGLLVQPSVLVFAVAAIVVAIAGKFGACWAAARVAGEPNAIALRVGTLMNARGLMQLIAINVGLAAGIVTRELFSVLVLVAIVTTVMATPMLSLWDRRELRRAPAALARQS
ncbi:Kef-type K+ transport system, membrane component KefB [Amycolatopsis sacchari]|uniref:Kef-type K+ transport system, membrane component KefB n=1 Tax=Amycolatopsis sacchari TaxID=115433 RepID=A0A1I4BEM6_9PSEU|nr:cation:proton antiporter [Amycolatopsis sacchari]SFK67265.1 Kef-type K+ transport system, membrane component KefB [Amycolatopsis sacchari]